MIQCSNDGARERHARRRPPVELAVQPRPRPRSTGEPRRPFRTACPAQHARTTPLHHRAEPARVTARARRRRAALAPGAARTGPVVPHPQPRHGSTARAGAVRRMALHGQEKQYWVGRVAVRQPGKDTSPTASSACRRSRLAARQPHDCTRLAVRAPPTREMACGSASRPTHRRTTRATTSIVAGTPDHDRRHRRGSTTARLRDRRVAARARGDLDRRERRPGARHARRRERQWTNVTPRGRRRRPRADGGAVAARPGGRYVTVLRYCWATSSLRLQDRRLRRDLAPPHRRVERRARRPPARVVREDPARAGLLYLGTEFGCSSRSTTARAGSRCSSPAGDAGDRRQVHRGDSCSPRRGAASACLDVLSPLRSIWRRRPPPRVGSLFRRARAPGVRLRRSVRGRGEARAQVRVDPVPPGWRDGRYWLRAPRAAGATLDRGGDAGRGAWLRSFLERVVVGERTQPPAEASMRATDSGAAGGQARAGGGAGRSTARLSGTSRHAGPWGTRTRRGGVQRGDGLLGTYSLRRLTAG
jgi:hypothetical protein